MAKERLGALGTGADRRPEGPIIDVSPSEPVPNQSATQGSAAWKRALSRPRLQLAAVIAAAVAIVVYTAQLVPTGPAGTPSDSVAGLAAEGMELEPAATHAEGGAVAPDPRGMPLEPAATHAQGAQIAALSVPADLPLVSETGFDPELIWPRTQWAPQPIFRKLKVGRGQTLMQMMIKAGVDREEAHRAIVALRKRFDPRRLRAGQELVFEFLRGPGAVERFRSMSLDTDVDRSVTVTRDPQGGFTAQEINHALTRSLEHGAGEIDSSLYVAGVEQQVPPPVMVDLIHIFSFDVDFQRDIRAGDGFSVMYERFRNEERGVDRPGDILYASLTLSGVTYRLWRHRTADGQVDYFDEKGQSVRKALMRTPIDGARISSRFGRRRHPILGYNKMHRGTDFAAPRGTPIYAAGDGTIERAGRKGGYGKYIRIRHNSTYKTAYAHMSRFARGMRPGKRVRQGQTIGYVGSTGRSTGPHLHYEVIRSGRKINSQKMRLPSGRKLKGKELDAFQSVRAGLDEQLTALLEKDTIQSASASDEVPVAQQ